MFVPIHIDRSRDIGLSDQITSQISRLIFEGILPPGKKLSSCRQLAHKLGVAVNTVIAAYQKLEMGGLIEARPRSGFYVSGNSGVHAFPEPREERPSPQQAHIADKIDPQRRGAESSTIWRPRDWRAYPYPFVCNQVDENDFPATQWRDCSRMALGRRNLGFWSSDEDNADSIKLIEQVNQRILPRRGLYGSDETTLITLGSQNGIFLAGYLFGSPGKVAAMEDPGYPDARKILQANFGRLAFIPVDEEGLIVDERLRDVDLVYTTPNRQFPTSVTMSERRRRALLEAAETYDFYILEDDYECDVDFRPSPPPALRSEDTTGRVIYLGSLSKGLAPGLRLGYLNAAPAFVAAARDCRSMMMRHPPFLLQHTAAIFLELGFYDGLLQRKKRDLVEKWKLTSGILQSHFTDFRVSGEFGGANFAMSDRSEILDAQSIAQAALEQGIVLEPIAPCFSNASAGKLQFRVGVSAVSLDRIEPGLMRLNRLIASLRSSASP